jgi:hypothetical protein
MAMLPTVEQVRAWCQVSPTACTDEQLGQVMAGEAANQAKACLLDPTMPDDERDDDLVQAFYRRCARELAARGLPLGITEGEQGPMRLSSFDAEVDRLEGHDRRFTFG